MSNNYKVQTYHGMAASNDVRTGFISGPGVYNRPVQYSVVDGLAIFEGCIYMGTAEEMERQANAAADDSVAMGVGITGDEYRWPNGIIPYTVDVNIPNVSRIADAIAHLEEHTDLRFVLRTPDNAVNYPNYVYFVRINANYCYSAVGMRGGRQDLGVSDGCGTGTIIHECCHAAGCWHEQSREDRDQFIQVKWENITENFESNFNQHISDGDDYGPYDYDSIMHYGTTAFSKNGQPTIVALQPGVTIGQRNGLSDGDIATLDAMYRNEIPHIYTGVWRQGAGGYALWVNATWTSFVNKWQELASQNLRLVDIHARRVGNENRYSGVWLEGSSGHALWANATWSSFVAKWQELAANNLRLVSIHVLRVNDENRYSGVWLEGSSGHALWANATWSSFVAKWQELAANNLRLVSIHVHRVGDQNRYTGVWRQGSDAHALWANATWTSFVNKWQELAAQNLRLVDVNVHRSDGQTRYTGVWRQGSDSYALWVNASWSSFVNKWQELAAQNLRLIDFEQLIPDANGDASAIGDSMAPDSFYLAELPEVGAGDGYGGKTLATGADENNGDGVGDAAFLPREDASEGGGGTSFSPADDNGTGAEEDSGDGMGGAVLQASDLSTVANGVGAGMGMEPTPVYS